MIWMLLACSAEDCALRSTLSSYTPDCLTAALVQYSGESRVVVGGTGGVLTVYLPESLTEQTTYGGTSGNSMLAILEVVSASGDSDALLSFDRTSTLTLAHLSGTEAELQLSLDFDGGTVSGPLFLPVSSRQAR